MIVLADCPEILKDKLIKEQKNEIKLLSWLKAKHFQEKRRIMC